MSAGAAHLLDLDLNSLTLSQRRSVPQPSGMASEEGKAIGWNGSWGLISDHDVPQHLGLKCNTSTGET